MVPKEFKPNVGKDTHHSNNDESEEHLAHGKNCWFVYHIFLSAFVNELEHLVGLDLAITWRNGPLELLEVQSFLNVTHHCHVGFWNNNVGSCIESKLFKELLVLVWVHDLSKEGWVFFSVDGTISFIEIHHIFKLRIELSRWTKSYVHSLQLFAVK